jgi:hypothetical protein
VPAKYSPHAELPPMRSAPVDVIIDPVVASTPACTPLT